MPWAYLWGGDWTPQRVEKVTRRFINELVFRLFYYFPGFYTNIVVTLFLKYKQAYYTAYKPTHTFEIRNRGK